MMLLLLQVATEAKATQALDTVTVSAIVVAVIQWLKKATWIPFVNQHSAGINRAISWGAAFISGAGLHYSYTGVDNGTLTITGLTLSSIMAAGWSTVQSYGSQWLVYNVAIKSRAADVAAVAEAPPAPLVVATPGVAAAAAEVKAEGVKQ